MSDLDKRINIEPNIAESSDPVLTFIGKDNTPIKGRILPNGTISFESSSGQLFTISDGLTGFLFAVNDISGMSAFDVQSDGTVRLAPYTGSVAVNKTQANATLDILGDIIYQYKFNPQTGTTYTIASTDQGKIIEMNNAGSNTVTIPLDSNLSLPIGTQFTVVQTGAGTTTISIEAGGTLNCTPQVSGGSAKLRARWSSATAIKRSADNWVVLGDLSA